MKAETTGSKSVKDLIKIRKLVEAILAALLGT